MTRVAVVGHVEWVDFLAVEGLPTRGQITPASRVRRNAGGGAVVAAVVLAGLGAEVDFYGAVGADEPGERAVAELESHGIRVHAARRADVASREVITFLEDGGERSIVVIGERLAPHGEDDLDWDRLDGADGVYVTAGDLGALHAARRARRLVATPRLAENLAAAALDVEIDALIYSADDAAERQWAEALAGHARWEVITDGHQGGHWQGESAGHWAAIDPPGPVCDAYGAGDSFAAGFTFGLAVSGAPAEAARIGAECGARALTHRGGP